VAQGRTWPVFLYSEWGCDPREERIDLTVDPPPNLGIEVDITSRTHPSIYEALRVPELWRFDQGKLQINILRNGNYVESEDSLNFLEYQWWKSYPDISNRVKLQVEMQHWRRFDLGKRAFGIKMNIKLKEIFRGKVVIKPIPLKPKSTTENSSQGRSVKNTARNIQQVVANHL